MKKIGTKLKEVRKKKGLSQEELADTAKVNLRTIQRIEKNESEPRGKTLNLICGVLNINAEDILDYGKQSDTSYLVYFNLSVISFLIIPIGNIIIPLILWLTKKDKIIGLKEAGINLLNFQIVWSVLKFSSLIIGVVFKIVHFPGGQFFLILWAVLSMINIILPIVVILKLKKGKTGNMYPNLIRIIK